MLRGNLYKGEIELAQVEKRRPSGLRTRLQRFVTAQDPVFERVLSELREGRKRSHWIWFIFPQLKGLGHSWEANHFGIGSRAEAEAYLGHPILGPRLMECTALVNRVDGHSIQEIFGSIDAVKFRSSMTLFGQAGADKRGFQEALDKYFGGQGDQLTLEMLGLTRGRID